MPVLLSEELRKTCILLHLRILERFPDSGLGKTCEQLLGISQNDVFLYHANYQ